MRKKLKAFFVLVLFTGAGGWGLACQVPVFRYALERWIGDVYSVRIFSSDSGGAFSNLEKEAVEYLQKARSDLDLPANFSIEFPTHSGGDSRLELRYPAKNRGVEGKMIWSGPLTSENAKRLVDSPCRTELVNRILLGHSVIWVLLKSGVEEKDKVARTALEGAVAKAHKSIPIPQGVVTAGEVDSSKFSGDPDDIVSDGIPLKIEFSIIEISRNDPAEAIFIEMLLNLEDDLHDLGITPMVFPVFGRNRVLEPLVGAGINLDTVLNYSTYLCGACSCEVKDQNPGMDLLVAANWEAAIEGTAKLRQEIQVGNTVKIDATAADSSPSKKTLLYMGLGFLLLGMVALVMNRNLAKKK